MYREEFIFVFLLMLICYILTHKTHKFWVFYVACICIMSVVFKWILTELKLFATYEYVVLYGITVYIKTNAVLD